MKRIGRAKLRGRLHAAARWLHICLSMVSFAVVLFFAVTGITLNHPELFSGHTKTVLRQGQIDSAAQAMLHAGDAVHVADELKKREALHGRLHDPQCDEQQCQFSFRAPGYTADGFVDRAVGSYTLTVVSADWLGVMNDLHRGHDADPLWHGLLDVTAGILCLVSISGLLLVALLHRRRVAMFLLLLAGMALVAVFLSKVLIA